MIYPDYYRSSLEELEGGNYIAQALELLSELHSIQGIRLSFHETSHASYAKFNLFFDKTNFPLLQRLMLIKGIRVLDTEIVVGAERKPICDGDGRETLGKLGDYQYYESIANFLDARSLMTANRYPTVDDIIQSLQAESRVGSSDSVEVVGLTTLAPVTLEAIVKDRQTRDLFEDHWEDDWEDVQAAATKALNELLEGDKAKCTF